MKNVLLYVAIVVSAAFGAACGAWHRGGIPDFQVRCAIGVLGVLAILAAGYGGKLKEALGALALGFLVTILFVCP